MLYFVTSNANKFKEAQLVLEDYGIKLHHLNIDKLEIQADNIQKISEYATEVIVEQYKKEILVEDAGLFIGTLNGFPGPYSSYVYKTIGCQGILNLLKDEARRIATFKAVLSYGRPEKNVISFLGEIKGHIAYSIRGSGGFGFDPIFMPNGSDETFAEMSISKKNQFSHRMCALKQFTEWYLSQKS